MIDYLKELLIAFRYKSDQKSIYPYHVYTREFDAIVSASQLDSVLGVLQPESRRRHELEWEELAEELAAWRREADPVIGEAASQIRAAFSEAELAQTAITLLLDQSGSVRNAGILPELVVACVIAERLLVGLGIKTEVLGFTTSSWRGGRSREKWKKSGRPAAPGRLCDLLHIVYKPFSDQDASVDDVRYKPMLRPGLLKENLDGEAVEWAVQRMTEVSATRKEIVVISDGAPVDHSTLSENQPAILHTHIQEVSRRVAESEIRLSGIGLEHGVHLYYPESYFKLRRGEIRFGLVEALKNVILN